MLLSAHDRLRGSLDIRCLSVDLRVPSSQIEQVERREILREIGLTVRLAYQSTLASSCLLRSGE